MLKIYASNPNKSRGRLHKEKKCCFGNDFQSDRERILHSSAFRRLEYKTQVFVNHEGDHYRTRLTHSLEVAQIARTISLELGVCEELAEILALAHDLGHPPFGHAGEEALQEVMLDFGGFDHNAQTLKILTKLESPYLHFDGLNLSWETIEGIVKHNGPIIGKYATKNQPILCQVIEKYCPNFHLELDKFPSIEAQISSVSDDIAYNNHDIEDGLRAGFFEIEDLANLKIYGKFFHEILHQNKYPDKSRFILQAIRKLINFMITDVVAISRENMKKYQISKIDDIRNLHCSIVNFSTELEEANLELKSFLFKHMYRHYKINRSNYKAKKVVKDLFQVFFHEPQCLPDGWRALCNQAKSRETALVVSDFIAGMTDRFALKEHGVLYHL